MQRELCMLAASVGELVEKARELHPELSGASAALFAAVQWALMLAPARGDGVEPQRAALLGPADGAGTRGRDHVEPAAHSGSNRKSAAGAAAAAAAVESCLLRMRHSVRRLVSNASNFYGICKRELYTEELSALTARLRELVSTEDAVCGGSQPSCRRSDCAWSPRSEAGEWRGPRGGSSAGGGGMQESKSNSSADSKSPTAVSPSGAACTGSAAGACCSCDAAGGCRGARGCCDRWVRREQAAALVSNEAAKLFWLSHVCVPEVRDWHEVAWSHFAARFEQQFQPQTAVAMSKLREALALRGTVTVHRFNEFTAPADGLHEAFQRLVDPGTAVIVLGTVADEDSFPLEARVPTLVDSLLGVAVTQVSCGGQHAAVLTNEGHVYTWGRGSFGRLGHGSTAGSAKPVLVESLRTRGVVVTQVACGFAYTAAVSADGDLFTWGAGENGRLGTGSTSDRSLPDLVHALAGNAVKEIFAGSVHTCALTRRGELFSFGKSEYAGHGGAEDVLLPKLLDGFQGRSICQVSVGPGGYHTIALAVNGDVFTWGHNRVGQLGFMRPNEDVYFLPTPQLVPGLSGAGVVRVVAGWGHSAALTDAGQVLICGRNYKGQLGLGDPELFPKNERGHPFLSEFRPLASLQGRRAVQVACGGEHTAVVLAEGDVATFGSGYWGQLGHVTPVPRAVVVGHGEPAAAAPPGFRNEFYPRRLVTLVRQRRQVLQVACGNNCTVLLAGPHSPPSLLELCVEHVAALPGAAARLERLGLPSELVQRIQEQAASCIAGEEGMLLPPPGSEPASWAGALLLGASPPPKPLLVPATPSPGRGGAAVEAEGGGLGWDQAGAALQPSFAASPVALEAGGDGVPSAAAAPPALDTVTALVAALAVDSANSEAAAAGASADGRLSSRK